MPEESPELDELLARVEELKRAAERGELSEATIRSLARSLSRSLRRHGYIVVVRKPPSWARERRAQVFLSRIGRRGRGGSREEGDDYFPDAEGLERRLKSL